MRYKIECFFYPTFYVYSKSALFDFLDCLKKYKNFALTDKFQISYSHGYFVRDIGYKYYKSDELEYHREFVREYVNDLYIIKDESNFVLDYDKIIDEYKQSRNIKEYVNKNKFYDFSTSKYRKTLGKAKYKISKHSYKKEFSSSCEALKNGIKIRKKRYNEIKDSFIFHYGNWDLRYRKTNKSWKSKKQTRQWDKKHR